jgi:hypothetical protein
MAVCIIMMQKPGYYPYFEKKNSYLILIVFQ